MSYESRSGRGSGRGSFEGRGSGRGSGRGGFEGRGSGRGSFEGRGSGRGSFEGRGSGRGSFESRGRGGPSRGRGGPAPLAVSVGPTTVIANHFRINIKPDAPPLHKHLVEIENQRDKEARMMFDVRRDILEKFLSSKHISPVTVVYDGDRCLYSPVPIQLTETFTLGRGSFNITISKQGSPIHLQRVTSPDQKVDREREQCLDVILKCASRKKCYPANQRNFLHEGPDAMRSLEEVAGRDPKAREIRPKKLWMGHFQSVGLSNDLAMSKTPTTQATICINAAAAVAYEQMPLSEFIGIRLNKPPYQMPTGKNWDARYARDFERQVKGLKFETHHVGGVRKMKIVGLVNKSAAEHRFLHNDKETNISDYFQDRYGQKLRYPNAPLVQKAPKKAESYLPLETLWLCKQTLNHSVTEFLKSLVGAIMTMDPGVRLDYIKKSVRTVYGDNDVLKQFGVQLNPEAMKVDSDILPAPTLLYSQPGKKNTVKTCKVSRGSWNLIGYAFNEARPIPNWAIINMLGKSAAGSISEVMRALTSMANNELNMQMNPNPRCNDLCLDIDALPDLADKYRDNKMNGKCLDVLFVFIPQPDPTVYKMIKSLFDDVCTTQVLTAMKTPLLNRKDASRAAGHWGNILSKINEKTGGVNQRLSHSALQDPAVKHFIGNDGNTVIISAAFSHPSPLSATRGARRLQMPSLCALVCSVDRECTRYIHSFRGQVCARETINDFAEMVAYVLERRARITGLNFPKRIIYLRDGVSDTGIDTLIDDELRGIWKVYQAAQVPKPQVLAIAVRRAHQTRFFPTNCPDSRTNMPPGTLVYDNLSMPLPYPNFYLISHAGIKGTSHPARYVVIKDDLKEKDSKLAAMSQPVLLKFYAQFIFQLAHLYGRCQRSVSVPAPVYYATLLAERGRAHVSDMVAQAFGLGLIAENESVTSHGSGHFVSEALSPEVLENFNKKMNDRLKDIEAAAFPMFYV